MVHSRVPSKSIGELASQTAHQTKLKIRSSLADRSNSLVDAASIRESNLVKVQSSVLAKSAILCLGVDADADDYPVKLIYLIDEFRTILSQTNVATGP